jgi:MFS family permease
MAFTLVYAFATPIQTGFALGEHGSVSYVFSAKFGWDLDGTALTKNMFITNAGILGILFGAVSGSKIVQISQSKNISMLKLLYIMNAIAIVANCVKLIRVYPLLLISRFVFGFVGGTHNVLLSKFITETVPVETLSIYGQAVNSCLNLGIALT